VSLFGLFFSALFRKSSTVENQSDGVMLDAYRVGSAIYLGTFLLGNNWDYRLIFLILTLPQLICWVRYSPELACFSKLTIIAILVSFWHMVIVKLFLLLPHGYRYALLLDEFANWFVFSVLGYLLFLSAPAWVKEFSREWLSKVFRKPSATGAIP